MDSDIFVSYARKDRDVVDPLVDRLRRCGASVWVDRRGLDGATQFFAEIARAIKRCRVLALMLSRHSAQSRFVPKEGVVAMEADKPILPLLLEDIEIPDALRRGVGRSCRGRCV